jgi:hypothetical protein
VVLPGQFLERPALVDAGGLTLDALYHRGAAPPAILLCPPLDAEGMDAPLLAELAWAAARAGHASLRFQHRGRGGSQGTFDPANALDDARAALAHLVATAGRRVAVAGLRGGCDTALRLAAEAGLRRAVLVAPDAPPRVTAPVATLALLPEAGAAVAPDAVAAALGPDGVVEVVEGADAVFRAGMSRAAARAVDWLRVR